MNWFRYDVHTTTKDAAIIGDVLTELGISGYEISDHVPLATMEEKRMFTDIPADTGFDDGSAVLIFYTPADTDRESFYSTGSSLRDARTETGFPEYRPEEFIAALQKRIAEIQNCFPVSMPVVTYCLQEDSLWKDKWKENFKPFYVAKDILIKPTWEPVPEGIKKETIILEIDPGSAFGTGTHETTKLCLLTLRKYLSSSTTILDAGCGSGILAIASLLCGAKSAFCLDIDPAAIKATSENAQKNHINQKRLQVKNANILDDSDALQRECSTAFDIAVANILADVIVPLSENIGNFLKPDGIFISSGILAEKSTEVEHALQKNHFSVLEKNTLGDWVCFAARKQ